jgi:hypothetical protein
VVRATVLVGGPDGPVRRREETSVLDVLESRTDHCPTCGDDRGFVQPPCVDGHGDGCPEWACADCGTALLTGVLPLRAPALPQRLAA